MKDHELAEKFYWLMRGGCVHKSSLTLQKVNQFLDDVAKYHDESQDKLLLFQHFYRDRTATELKWLTKIVLKDLRLGLFQKKAFEGKPTLYA